MVVDKELFLIACLYHDIGKQVSIDNHATEGAILFREKVAPKLGISHENTDYICSLIRRHLELFEKLIKDDDESLPSDVRMLGLIDLAACYMEYWDEGNYDVLPYLVTDELLKLKDITDGANGHEADMYRHSVLAYYIGTKMEL